MTYVIYSCSISITIALKGFTINPRNRAIKGPELTILTMNRKYICWKFDEKYFSSADYDAWLRMFSMGMKLKRINKYMGDFLYRPDSVSQAKLRESEKHDREIQAKYKT